MWLSECDCIECKHRWLPLTFGERECLDCGLVNYPPDEDEG